MNQGFSLVELSIVLVILGLLTGGILTGQNLIRAAELRSVATQASGYQTAVMTFRDKYFALPGDMGNATRFWGKNNTACPTHTGTAAANGVCNGNMDGSIRLNHLDGGGGYPHEAFQFWQHLALAGLIEGSYTGISGSTAYAHSIPGTNVPPARISNAAWGARYFDNLHPASFALSPGVPGNHFTVGSTDNALMWPQSAFLRPEEAWNIDTKLDDGKPARGNVLMPLWNLCTTATVNTDLNADYNLTDSGLRCGMWLRW